MPDNGLFAGWEAAHLKTMEDADVLDHADVGLQLTARLMFESESAGRS